MFGCNCRSPSEHAEHLRREREEYNKLFPEIQQFFVLIPPDGLADALENSEVLKAAYERERTSTEEGDIAIELNKQEWLEYVVRFSS